MPSGPLSDFSITVDHKALDASIAKWVKLNDRAAMRGVRAAGRVVRSAARSRAPVDTGALKKSIKSSRQLKRYGPAAYGMTVAPRGFPQTAYAGKEEAAAGYMSGGFDAAGPAATAAFEQTWARVLAQVVK